MPGLRPIFTTLALAAAIAIARPVNAANTTCANANFLLPGQVISTTIPAVGALYYRVQVVSGRSYSILSWSSEQDNGEGGVDLDNSFFVDSGCTTGAPVADGQDYEPLLFQFPLEAQPTHSGDNDSIIPNFTGWLYIRIENGRNASYPINVLVTETTLFSSWWFVGGTNQAFVEIRNNMDIPTNAVVTAFRSTGAVCGTVALVIPGNGNTFVNVKTAAGFSCNTSPFFGSAQIAFFGTPGGLTANITSIDGVQGTSFDAPFSPRIGWATFGR